MVGLHGTEKSRNKTGKENFSSDDDEDETHLHAQSSMSLLHRVRGTKSKGVEYLVLVVLFVFLLLLLIWDMKTTSILSEIIHDDHADLWQHMNTSIINKWLSPLDFCMLKIDQVNVDVRAYRQKNCTKLQGLNPPDSVKLFCGIGSSLGKPCTSPLSTRSFFKSHLIGTLGDPHNKLLRTSLRLMAEDKKVLVFIGDAISKQNQEATVCELMRTDRIIISGGSRASLNSTTSEFVIHWRDNPALSIEIIFLHVAHLNNDHSNRKNERHLQQRIINDSLQPKINSSNYAQNSPSITLSSATAHLDNLLVRFPGGVVIVANIGVWYNSREKFRNELPIFLRWLNSLGKDSKNLILFRETAAQHWNHTGLHIPAKTQFFYSFACKFVSIIVDFGLSVFIMCKPLCCEC